MGVIGAVFCRFSGSIVDKNQICHDKRRLLTGAKINVSQNFFKSAGLFAIFPFGSGFLEDFEGPVGERNRSITVLSFWRTGAPFLLLMAKFQSLIDRQCALIPVDSIPSKADYFTGTET